MPGLSDLAMSDAEVIAASVDDPGAFAAVFDRYYDVVTGFLRRRLERSLADELAAETFLRAFDGRARYDVSRRDARPWLFGIAAHLVSHHRRAEGRRLRAFARVAQRAFDEQATDAVEARLDALSATAVLASGLASLNAREREVLLLKALPHEVVLSDKLRSRVVG